MKKTNFLILLSISILLSCQQATNNSSPNDSQTISENSISKHQPEEKKGMETYIAIVGNLRIRSIPDTDGDILGKMEYGQKAIFLDEESDFKEKIKLRGKMRYDSWKKVKVKQNSNSEIEGWVYGGGLIKESEVYKKTSSDNFKRSINRVSHSELSKILDMKIEEEYYYDGFVNYKRSPNGEFVKNGKFEAKGTSSIEISNNYNAEITVEITGNYSNGKPNGIFEMKFNGYENSNVTTINFENGKCLWSSCIGDSEGMDYSHREENPKDCSFGFVQRKLNEAYGWD